MEVHTHTAIRTREGDQEGRKAQIVEHAYAHRSRYTHSAHAHTYTCTHTHTLVSSQNSTRCLGGKGHGCQHIGAVSRVDRNGSVARSE